MSEYELIDGYHYVVTPPSGLQNIDLQYEAKRLPRYAHKSAIKRLGKLWLGCAWRKSLYWHGTWEPGRWAFLKFGCGLQFMTGPDAYGAELVVKKARAAVMWLPNGERCLWEPCEGKPCNDLERRWQAYYDREFAKQ